jgi:hypothetical protein
MILRAGHRERWEGAKMHDEALFVHRGLEAAFRDTPMLDDR